LFSIHPSETPASLTAYRGRESIPLNWNLGAAGQSEIDALLDSIGFQSAQAGTEFMHPNILVFFDPKLHVAKWIYGTDYRARDFDAAPKVASRPKRLDWRTLFMSRIPSSSSPPRLSA
jgi:hypothetical protein